MWIDRESKIDLLAYNPFAELVTNITANDRMNPLTVGLFGSWGVGKSTLLKLVENKINKLDPSKKKIVCISLNSWMFEGYDDAKSAIMESLLRTLEDNQPAFEGLKEDIKSLVKRIDFIRLGATVLKHGTPFLMGAMNPAVAAITAAQYMTEEKRAVILEDLKKVWKEKEQDPKDTMVENIRLFRKEFKDLLDKSKIGNLVVMIDDLDRCTPERVIETLEAIKLFLSVPKTTYIIAVDTQVIKYAVEKKYPKINEDTIRFSDNYIEKIIQLPIYIPELSELDLKNYLLLLICELFMKEDVLNRFLDKLSEDNLFLSGAKVDLEYLKKALGTFTEDQFRSNDLIGFINMFQTISVASDVMACTLKGNPRQAKRFLNTFLIRKSLAKIYYKKDPEFNYSILAKLMSLEYIDEKLFKDLYRWSLANKSQENISELKQLTEIVIRDEELPEEFRKWGDERVLRWLKSDPQNLYEKDLSRYFYLTRESLNINFSVSDSLSKEEMKIFTEILRAKKLALFNKIIKELKDNSHIRFTKILDALIERSRDDIKMLEKMQSIYFHYPEYRADIKDLIKKIKNKDLTLVTANILNGMYRKEPDEFQDVIKTLQEKNINSDLMEIICQQDNAAASISTQRKP
ncbi:Phage T7 exclusion protein [Desulfosporosinus sp. I2]|uniref:KAP family P-loop NTPase fold protein n=1 Tax=Desulfosporosinus sp. I2 TaxID=1617025 RepID=UPI0005F0AA16|nr:P-loop NTPase fold protein [Desulfosporosinus sp. I2]KJR46050.1 Phage T7 exclusion protein [Desulfosporosinus sp. I2]